MTSPGPTIRRIRAHAITIPRETPYLGGLESGTPVTAGGYFVRPGNRSVYNVDDQSVLLQIELEDGTIGWGEAVAFYAPETLLALCERLVGPLIIGRSVHEVVGMYDDLYDAMRVRGFFGGYYHDMLAALDIALWDARGRSVGLSVAEMIGGTPRQEIPAYISGLPGKTIEEKQSLAFSWLERGFTRFKFAAAVAKAGSAGEMAAIREAVGAEAAIAADLHWNFSAGEAMSLIRGLRKYDLWFAEAPCRPEDIQGLANVAAAVPVPIAGGEELRTVYEYLPRLERRAFSIVQPEMGRTGITSFLRIGDLAKAFHCSMFPHASIGIGVFQAASLHASAGMSNAPYHEYQHSVFDRNLQFLEGDMSCQDGAFRLPSGPGLGVTPSDLVEQYIRQTTEVAL